MRDAVRDSYISDEVEMEEASSAIPFAFMRGQMLKSALWCVSPNDSFLGNLCAQAAGRVLGITIGTAMKATKGLTRSCRASSHRSIASPRLSHWA